MEESSEIFFTRLFADIVSCVDNSLLLTLTPLCTYFFLHVHMGVCACVRVCVCTHHPDRFYQQRSAGLYLEWHLEGLCGGNV